MHERPGQALTGTLAEHLRGRHLLVVFDNCEHLVVACAELVAGLVSACPDLHVLATSRVPLVVAGEATFVVAGLAVPDPGVGSADTVAAADAARLFEVRAQQVAAEFRIDDGNAAAWPRFVGGWMGSRWRSSWRRRGCGCWRRARSRPGCRTASGCGPAGCGGPPARQRTLEASLDWSYQLLDDVQRLALARLAVFAGSFELDAAEEVVGGDDIDGDDVLDLVSALVEQSMLEVAQRHGRARYRLLETIRVYARQRVGRPA